MLMIEIANEKEVGNAWCRVPDAEKEEVLIESGEGSVLRRKLDLDSVWILNLRYSV